jgi:D-3-phosphoglycerate dehydrogenase
LSQKYKFIITDYGFPAIDAEQRIIQNAGAELAAFHCNTQEDVITAGRDADVLIVQWAPITKAVIQTLPQLKAIVRYGIGADNIDLDAAREHGVMVSNVPDYCIDEVADHTFALALSLARQLLQVDRQVRQNTWKIVPPQPMPASREMIFVTIGYGRIARAVLERARACKFHLATCDPYLPASVVLPEDIQKLDMNEAFKTADILSLHAPLSKDTYHLANSGAFSKMKPTSILINTARGSLVDTVALADALQRGQIAGAALDVFEHEPLEENHPLRDCPNALLTSHVAWYSEKSVPELQRLAAEEAVRTMSGEPLRYRIA